MEKEKSKQCTKCGLTKPLSDFHVDRSKSDGLSPSCKSCKVAVARQYQRSNREKVRRGNMLRYKENRDAINAARRKHPDTPGRGQFNKQHPDHVDFGASNRKPRGESSFLRLARQYMANARRRHIEFHLSNDQMRKLTAAPCAYCGQPPSQVMQMRDANGPYVYNGIDRKNPAVGYTSDNCVSCCGVCNKAKGKMTHEAWLAWIDRIVVFHVAGNVGFKKTIVGDEVPKSIGKRQ